MKNKFFSVFLFSWLLFVAAVFSLFSVQAPLSVFADTQGEAVHTPSGLAADSSVYSAATPTDLPSGDRDEAAEDGADEDDPESYTIRYYAPAGSGSGSSAGGEAPLGQVTVDPLNLSQYGSFTLMVPVSEISFSDGSTFGGWTDENGSSLYCYVYNGFYNITVYPAVSCSIYCRSAAEDYFIEDIVRVFGSEKVSLEAGEE